VSGHTAKASGRLGDTTARNYSRKLELFNAFAELELRRVIAGLALTPGMRILDAGCGTGEALKWFRDEIGEGEVIGVDLAAAHTCAARERAPADTLVAQADLQKLPFCDCSFDLIWSVNTINHLNDARDGVRRLAKLLRPGGRIALGQSSLVPDMYFSWDARLERLTTEAVRQYYRDRYRLEERDLTAVRALVGVARDAKLNDVRARTIMIERVFPLRPEDKAYLSEAIFRDTWGERLRPYLSSADYEELNRLCDPTDPAFALERPDFHFLQSFTLVSGAI
jgi:SAM-dependent methyltransferase